MGRGSIEEGLNEAEFYGGSDNPRYSQHYAQCRYLCYYLQERGLLVRFYGEFTAHAQSDPSGEKSLKNILGTEDLGAVQKQWEKFVLGLRSP